MERESFDWGRWATIVGVLMIVAFLVGAAVAALTS